MHDALRPLLLLLQQASAPPPLPIPSPTPPNVLVLEVRLNQDFGHPSFALCVCVVVDVLLLTRPPPPPTQLNNIACKGYLVADLESRRAALIDPEESFVDRYLAVLAYHGLTLEYLIETHTHADHISSGRMLQVCRVVIIPWAKPGRLRPPTLPLLLPVSA